MAHSRLHEPAPIEGEGFDDEQQNRSITESMAERLARQQSAMMACLQSEAESRVERAQNRRTRGVQHRPSGTRVCLLLESRRSEYGFFAHDSAGVYGNSEQTQKCMVGSCDSPPSQHTHTHHHHHHHHHHPLHAHPPSKEMGRSQEQHEEAHGTVWILGRLLRCAPEHLRHLSERESLSIDRDRGNKDKARTFTDIVQDFRFSNGAQVDLRSQQDPLTGPSCDTSAERFL